MARVTVEDCLDRVDNRFQLVMLAAKRARDLILKGLDPTVPWENDKATVVALREIANGDITPEYLNKKPALTEAELIREILPELPSEDTAIDAATQTTGEEVTEESLQEESTQEPTEELAQETTAEEPTQEEPTHELKGEPAQKEAAQEPTQEESTGESET